ncbi:MAG: N-acetylglucosamine-6-phosphate deacetylase [Armatimonadota bacterium]|nr:MAG: N-acetylglucosamine-6-phosphate deacetylase [Armatimonadota bacterium]
MRTAVRGGRVVTPLDVFDQADIIIEDGRILAIGPGIADADVSETIDAEGQIVAPGYIDVHVHGSAGHDTMDGTREAIEGMAKFFAGHGVTSFCPTTLTAPPEALMASVRAVHECQQNAVEGAQPLGVHLEGPYIEAGKKGAQPEEHVRAAAAGDYKELFSCGNIRLITFAPEIEENKELIAFARSRGAAAVVGHSDATYEQMVEAVKLGLNHATHTFNQMTGIHHRKPGTVSGVLLLDEIYAEFIADGIHLHPAIVDMIVRLKGPGKALLITDAISGAGMPEGDYELGGQRIVVKEGAVRLEDGTLAGSALTMDQAVRNVRRFTRRPLRECIQMATLTPARSIGAADRKGSLEQGKDADVVILDPDLDVLTTIVAGKVVPRA